MYAYISHGADGHGAFPAQGSSVANRINKGSNDADTLSNASELTNFSAQPNNTFVKKDRVPGTTNATGFDDLLYYHTDSMNTCCIGNSCGFASPSGFIVQGSANDKAGTSLAFGDINGDGIDDLTIGAPGNGSTAGKVYVIFGSKSLYSGSFSASSGLTITGANIGDKFGSSVAIGDINGDGIKDLIIGAPGYSSNAGATYVIFGATGAWSNLNLNTTPLNGTNGFVITGAAGDAAGTSVAAGNISAHTDGTQDVIIGAPGIAGSAGKAYVVFGVKPWGGAATFSLPPTGVNGFEMDGSSGEGAGTSVASGDINGDGVSDVIIGAPNASTLYTNNGNVYVVFGGTAQGTGGKWLASSSAAMSLSGLNGTTGVTGTNGIVTSGSSTNEYDGTSVASADINGDGIADLIIGAPGTQPQGRANAGSAYVVYGKNTTWLAASYAYATSFNLSTLNASSTGFRLDGATANEKSGTSVAGGCSVNGTGVGDVLIGAPNATVNAHANSGVGYIAFGASSGWASTNNLSAITQFGTSGYKTFDNANNVASYLTGSSIVSGDINNTGKCATAIGAPGASSNAGYIYVILGRSPWSSPFDLSTLR